MGSLHQNIFTRKVTDIAFTSDFCNNHSHPASPASLYLTSPRPRPTRPRVPYLMSSSPSSRVPKSPHTRPDVPVPILYTAHSLDFEDHEPQTLVYFTPFLSSLILNLKTYRMLLYFRYLSPVIVRLFLEMGYTTKLTKYNSSA